MKEICGDNGFEIIAKAKEHLLDGTNIDTSEDEMKVLDSFLFRCWQMGWLDKYDRKTENCSEKPNNCEKDCFLCKWLGNVDVCGRCRNRNLFAEADTEPTISKMEQVGKE